RPERRLLRRQGCGRVARAVGILQAHRRDRRSMRAAQGVARMKVAGIQHDIVWENPAANFAALAPKIGRAVDDGARLVVLTEMFSTGFSMRTDVTAERE